MLAQECAPVVPHVRTIEVLARQLIFPQPARALMVEVRVTDGQLTVWWPNQDEPVANLKGSWRGPIRPFGETSIL
jgi:hypothetical protein